MARAVAGETYWAPTDHRGHPEGSPWVTLIGSHWGVRLDPTLPGGEGAAVFTEHAAAIAYQELIPAGAAAKTLPIEQVMYAGAGLFRTP